MKKIILFILIFIKVAMADTWLEPRDSDAIHVPGEIITGILSTNDSSIAETLSASILKRKSIEGQIYFMDVGTWIKMQGQDLFTVDVKFICNKEFNLEKKYFIKLSDRENALTFKNFKFDEKAQAPQGSIDYELTPEQMKWMMKTGIALLVIILLGIIVLWLRKKRNAQRKKYSFKETQTAFLSRFNGEIDRIQVEEWWLRRDELSQLFPQSQDALREFYQKLNRYQFMPQWSPEEEKKMREELRRTIDLIRKADGV